MPQTTSRPAGTSPMQPPPHQQSPRPGDGQRPAPNGVADVPERPSLAPNIQLSGKMEESGFAEPQWMVQRNGQFIHLTELLYHVVEQIDGQRTLDEIARRMSEQINRDVSADNVRQLIGTKLIPLGVVVGGDGKVVGTGTATEGIARSPLKINMKTKVLPRGLITPLTNVLKVLFFPPVLIVVLLACIASQVWLFAIHGIAGSIHEAVYKPWLTLVLLGIVIVGTAWHEFGHAAALEYGGGKVRGMGMGFYLVYPAFYTDVTDNYRLGRWARVRTDLGGFYFNLIFSLGLVGLYLLTGQPFLLLAVLLIDIDIIHQCLPFVRLDGYWALADITGIPDFFSYMGPFIRGVLPIKRRDSDKGIPEFKRWVKVLFALYILVTIPVLAFLLFVMIKNVPRILATAWDSFHHQGIALSGAWNGGHYGGVTLAVLQMLLLALPVAGLGFTLFSLARAGFRALWNWSRPTPARRAVGSLATAMVAALLAYLWIPNLPFGGRANPIAAQDTWRPIAANERGTIADAAPRIVPLPFRSPVTAPTATAAPSATGPVGTTGTARVTTTPGASGTPGATPSGTPAIGTPTVIPTPVSATPVPASVPAQPPASGSGGAVGAPPVTTAPVPAAPSAPPVATPAPTVSTPASPASTASATQPSGSASAAPAPRGTSGLTPIPSVP